MTDFELQLTPLGRLALTLQGQRFDDVVPVRCFPLTAPDEGLSLVDTDGKERLWIERLDQVPASAQQLIEEALRLREFSPHIRQIQSVSTFTTPSTWQVDTDRGVTQLVLHSEEDIRRLAPNALLITDARGVQFRISDTTQLERRSKRLLERFL